MKKPTNAPASDSTSTAPAGTGTQPSGAEPDENDSGSILTKIRNEWKAQGSKDPAVDDGKKLVAIYIETQAKVTAAEEALAKAKAAEYGAVEKLARAYGGRSLRIGGVIHDFASRGTIIFFRKKTASEVVDL
jgi:hypothetical protein